MQTKNTVLFWSPVFRWMIDELELKIEMFNYGRRYVDLFPEFYFMTQKGIDEKQLLLKLEYKKVQGIEGFIKDLLKRHVLISDVLEIQQLVYIQNHLFKNQYDEAIKFNAEALDKFKKNVLTRSPVKKSVLDIIKLPACKYSSIIEMRETVRNFDMNRKMEQETFFNIISCLRQKKEMPGHYYYASAGGLYPIDIYVYCKPGRIENISEGLYYYSPNKNQLQKICDRCDISSESQYLMNKEIFDKSAFSMYFIYNADVSMPKYGGMGYVYSCIDTGLMVALLTYVSETNGVGSCSIGEMNYKMIRKIFPISSTMSFLHSMEFGMKTISRVVEV